MKPFFVYKYLQKVKIFLHPYLLENYVLISSETQTYEGVDYNYLLFEKR